MIKSKTVQVYNWFDIEEEICRVMGIERDKFRNYHKVIGCDYRDLWHVALDSVVPDNMANDTFVTMYVLEVYEYFIKRHGEWTRPFFEAYNKVFYVLDPNFNGVLVRFSW